MDDASGAGYDTYAAQYSPEGRVFQVEYARKAEKSSGTAIGLRGKDGIVFAVENLISSKLYETETNNRIFTIDSCIGMTFAGVLADGRHIVNMATEEAAQYRIQYNQPVPINILKNNISMYMHAYTLYSAFRPFGVSAIVGAYEFDEPKMYCIDPSGVSFSYFGCAIGKAKQAATSEIEDNYRDTSIIRLVKEAAKIIYMVHEGDRNFELELSWVGAVTHGKHKPVPPAVFKPAVEYAKIVTDDTDDDSDDEPSP